MVKLDRWIVKEKPNKFFEVFMPILALHSIQSGWTIFNANGHIFEDLFVSMKLMDRQSLVGEGF